MVMTVKAALKADRVGLFVLSEDKRSMVLKVIGRMGRLMGDRKDGRMDG